jgi:hypothetical protein
MGVFILIAFVIAAILVGLFVSSVNEQNEKERNRNRLHDKYKRLLAELEQTPDSVELRAAALTAGRLYSEACRQEGKVALFDEVALSNDLAARTGKVADTKICPDCAEQVKVAARKCRAVASLTRSRKSVERHCLRPVLRRRTNHNDDGFNCRIPVAWCARR